MTILAPGAYASMPHPVFGAKYVNFNYNEKRWPSNDSFLGRPACISLPLQDELFFLPAFIARKMTPGHKNPAMGFFGGVDQD